MSCSQHILQIFITRVIHNKNKPKSFLQGRQADRRIFKEPSTDQEEDDLELYMDEGVEGDALLNVVLYGIP